MLARVLSGGTIGLEGYLVEVEVDVAQFGLPTFTIVGLPNKAIDEAKDRVRSALVNVSFEMPDSRLTVNLAPADIPKEGSSFDLPIAVGILAASGMVKKESLEKSLFIGELSLEGAVRRVPGVISMAQAARTAGISNLFVPWANAAEASLIEGVTIYAVRTVPELVLHLNDQKPLNKYVRKEFLKPDDVPLAEFDFSQIIGQKLAKRALEIAAAGFHNIHLKGPPGAGKTLLSRAFPSLLPQMSKEEILEVTKIYSAVGLIQPDILLFQRPFRAPHNTTSRIGLIGGGSHPKPGEISLAHRGVLFLDEFAEFPRSVLESLRQPIEDGVVSISRAAGSLTFPARFLLVAASNPCPCGYLGHPKKTCHCLPTAVLKYKKKISGPLLDRIDLHVDVPPVEKEDFEKEISEESSKQVRSRVEAAWDRQKIRWGKRVFHPNGLMKSSEVKELCKLEKEASELLKQAIVRLSLSARSYFKIIKVGQTIADLSAKDAIGAEHIAEALQYRSVED